MTFATSAPPHACSTQSDELHSTCPSFPVANTDRMSLLWAHSCCKCQHPWHAWTYGPTICLLGWVWASVSQWWSAPYTFRVWTECGFRPQSVLPSLCLWNQTARFPFGNISRNPGVSLSNVGTQMGLVPSSQKHYQRLLASVSMCCGVPSLYPGQGVLCNKLMLINQDWVLIESVLWCSSFTPLKSLSLSPMWSNQIMSWDNNVIRIQPWFIFVYII